MAVVVPVAGCGGGDDLTSDEYRRMAGEICDRANDAEARASTETRRTAAKLREVTRITVEKARDLVELDPPPELEEDHERLVSGFHGQGEALEDELIPRLDAGKDPTKAWEIAQVKAAPFNNRADFAAADLDVPECELEAAAPSF